MQFLQNHLTEMDAKKLNSPTWPTVTYMVSQIQYGGRITDRSTSFSWTRTRASTSTRGRWRRASSCSPGTSSRTRRTSTSSAPRSKLSRAGLARDFRAAPNADLTFRTLAVASLSSTVVEHDAQGWRRRRRDVPRGDRRRICEDLLGKVPQTFEAELTKELLRKLPGGPTQPLTVHLRQEIDRLNIIMDLTTKTLRELAAGHRGHGRAGGRPRGGAGQAFQREHPPAWLKKSWESATIGSWFQGLLRRHDQLRQVAPPRAPEGYWLTGFFNPQGFLTAMKQEVNRLHAKDKWALDDVVMTSEVTNPPKEIEQLKDEPKEGVYVYGLFLEGCRWDGKMNCLVDSEPKKLFTPLPVLYVTGVQQKDKPTKNVFEAPTYKVKKRTGLNFITTFTVRTQEPTSKWVMRGVALLASVD